MGGDGIVGQLEGQLIETKLAFLFIRTMATIAMILEKTGNSLGIKPDWLGGNLPTQPTNTQEPKKKGNSKIEKNCFGNGVDDLHTLCFLLGFATNKPIARNTFGGKGEASEGYSFEGNRTVKPNLEPMKSFAEIRFLTRNKP